MSYRISRILGRCLRVTDLRGKPIAMFDPQTNEEFRWQDNRWKKSPIQSKSERDFARTYGCRMLLI